MRKFIWAALALALATGFAEAADTERVISNPTAMVEAVKADDLAAMLRELGAANVQIEDIKGEKVVSFSDGGVPFSIAITLCEKGNTTNCIGFAQLLVMKDGGYSYETLNQLNVDTTTLTLFKGEGGGYIGIARVELVDGGVTRARVANAILWYVAEAHDAIKKLTTQVVAGVAPDGKTSALAAGNASAPQAVKPDAETATRMFKTLNRLADKRPLKKLNAK